MNHVQNLLIMALVMNLITPSFSLPTPARVTSLSMEAQALSLRPHAFDGAARIYVNRQVIRPLSAPDDFDPLLPELMRHLIDLDHHVQKADYGRTLFGLYRRLHYAMAGSPVLTVAIKEKRDTFYEGLKSLWVHDGRRTYRDPAWFPFHHLWGQYAEEAVKLISRARYWPPNVPLPQKEGHLDLETLGKTYAPRGSRYFYQEYLKDSGDRVRFLTDLLNLLQSYLAQGRRAGYRAIFDVAFESLSPTAQSLVDEANFEGFYQHLGLLYGNSPAYLTDRYPFRALLASALCFIETQNHAPLLPNTYAHWENILGLFNSVWGTSLGQWDIPLLLSYSISGIVSQYGTDSHNETRKYIPFVAVLPRLQRPYNIWSTALQLLQLALHMSPDPFDIDVVQELWPIAMDLYVQEPNLLYRRVLRQALLASAYRYSDFRQMNRVMGSYRNALTRWMRQISASQWILFRSTVSMGPYLSEVSLSDPITTWLLDPLHPKFKQAVRAVAALNPRDKEGPTKETFIEQLRALAYDEPWQEEVRFYRQAA